MDQRSSRIPEDELLSGNWAALRQLISSTHRPSAKFRFRVLVFSYISVETYPPTPHPVRIIVFDRNGPGSERVKGKTPPPLACIQQCGLGRCKNNKKRRFNAAQPQGWLSSSSSLLQTTSFPSFLPLPVYSIGSCKVERSNRPRG